jgi:amino acid adenylation domain-containing protein
MYQDPGVELHLGGPPIQNQVFHNGSAKFDITMTLWNKASHINGSIEYSSELFTERSIQGFLGSYFHLIEEVTKHPDQALGNIQLVHPSQVSEAALFGPISTIEYDNLPALFEGSLAKRTASNSVALSHTAVVGDQQTLTYQQLPEKMQRVSAFLHYKGIKSGDLVGICMHRSPDLIPILLGILKTGAAYVPLDPEYPSDRLKYMISHSRMGCIITESSLNQKVAEMLHAIEKTEGTQAHKTPRMLLAKECLESSVEMASQNKTQIIGGEQTAYVIYTSGSTGVPKGVNVPHRALVNFLTSMQSTPGFSSDDRLMALTTLSFDISILEIFLPIVCGGTVDIVPMDISRDVFALLNRMTAFNPTIMQATPATWRLLLVAGLSEARFNNAEFNDAKAEKPQIKALIGGEALPNDLVSDLLPCVKELWNMYGPTETTIWSTCQRITDAAVPIEIGTPIANTQCYILDEQQRLLPSGVPGELYIGGKGVSHGYLHQENLTQERFIECPDFAEGLLYKTGDRVTRLAQGVLRYHNRLDLQVKIRGYRIELGEIEHQLLALPELLSGAVIAHDQRILAFYVLKANTKLSKLKIRKHLAKVLPKHMLPDFYVELESLPLTPAGKIDRKKLAQFEMQSNETSKDQMPTTTSELYYGNIWANLLNKAPNTISVQDNFFDIGGHSLLSLQVVAQTKKDHGVQIPAAALVLNTLGQLAINYPLPEPSEHSNSVAQEQQQPLTPPLSVQKGTFKSKLSDWWQTKITKR